MLHECGHPSFKFVDRYLTIGQASTQHVNGDVVMGVVRVVCLMATQARDDVDDNPGQNKKNNE